MDELLEHYTKAPIFTSEHGEKLYLIKPLQWPSTHKWALQPDLTGPDQTRSDLTLKWSVGVKWSVTPTYRSFLTSKQRTYWIPTHRKIAGFNIYDVVSANVSFLFLCLHVALALLFTWSGSPKWKSPFSSDNWSTCPWPWPTAHFLFTLSRHRDTRKPTDAAFIWYRLRLRQSVQGKRTNTDAVELQETVYTVHRSCQRESWWQVLVAPCWMNWEMPTGGSYKMNVL